MPRFIVKPSRDQDEYLMWSTVVDAPVSGVMSREEMFTLLTTIGGSLFGGANTEEEAEARLTRTDMGGTSLKDCNFLGYGHDMYVRIENMDVDLDGDAKHEDLAKLTRAMDRKDVNELYQLIEERDDEQ